MADIYVDSNAVGANTGADWANAYPTLALAAAVDVAGDTIYVANTHNESNTINQTIALAGILANTVKVLCTTTAATPPTTLTTGAKMSVGGSNAIAISGVALVQGLTFEVGTGVLNGGITLSSQDNSHQTFTNCTFLVKASNLSSFSLGNIGNANGIEGAVTFNNCVFGFGNATRGLQISFVGTVISGGSLNNTIASLSLFVISSASTVNFLCKDFDFTNASSTLNLVYGACPSSGRFTFQNCKMPASWSGSPVATSPINPNLRVSMYNCDNASTNYRLWIETSSGSIKSEISIIRNYGATNGTTPISWKLVTNANANEYVAPLITDDMAVWVDSIGSVKKITVDILHDSATTLTDAQIWLEIDYLGSSATPLGTPLSDKRATVLTTAANQPTSTASWTTTGLTTPNKQKLEVTFTPQMKGFVYARVCLAKPSYTVYVDPQAILS